MANELDRSGVGYTANIVANAVLLYVANHLLEWNVPVLTPAFADVLWAIDLSLGATIVVNALYLAYDAALFRHVTALGLDALALLSTYTIYRVFPFAEAWWNELVQLSLGLVMLCICVAMLVHVVQSLADGLKVAPSTS